MLVSSPAVEEPLCHCRALQTQHGEVERARQPSAGNGE